MIGNNNVLAAWIEFQILKRMQIVSKTHAVENAVAPTANEEVTGFKILFTKR